MNARRGEQAHRTLEFRCGTISCRRRFKEAARIEPFFDHVTRTAIAVPGFIQSNLQSNNFNNNGTVYVNLDSYWDKLNTSQLISFANTCHANGLKAGPEKPRHI